MTIYCVPHPSISVFKANKMPLRESNNHTTRAIKIRGSGDNNSANKLIATPTSPLPPLPPSTVHSHSNSNINDHYSKVTSPFTALCLLIHDTFLPVGYPRSVSRDYRSTRFWDVAQTLLSSITGTLAARSVLKGVGVGASQATAASGVLAWLFKDFVGLLGRILFAALLSNDLDTNAKRWRLVADFANDAALTLEVLSSRLPAKLFLSVWCLASTFKAVSAVAGAASRVALTEHVPLRHNAADVNAKNGSQDTLANIVGMSLGAFVTMMVPDSDDSSPSLFTRTAAGKNTTVPVFCALTGLHLYCNYRCVKAMEIPTLNEHRAVIVIDHYLDHHYDQQHDHHHVCQEDYHHCILSPSEANQAESVLFPVVGLGKNKKFSIELGASAQQLLDRLVISPKDFSSDADFSTHVAKDVIALLEGIPDGNGIPPDFVACAEIPNEPMTADTISCQWSVLLRTRNPRTLLGAYFVIMSEMRYLSEQLQKCEPIRRILTPSNTDKSGFERFLHELERAGWNLNKLHLPCHEWRMQTDQSKEAVAQGVLKDSLNASLS